MPELYSMRISWIPNTAHRLGWSGFGRRYREDGDGLQMKSNSKVRPIICDFGLQALQEIR